MPSAASTSSCLYVSLLLIVSSTVGFGLDIIYQGIYQFLPDRLFAELAAVHFDVDCLGLLCCFEGFNYVFLHRHQSCHGLAQTGGQTVRILHGQGDILILLALGSSDPGYEVFNGLCLYFVL